MFVHCLQPVRFVLDQSYIHVSIFPFHAAGMEDDVAPAADEPMADAEDLVGDVPAGPRTLQDMLHGYGNAYWARLPQEVQQHVSDCCGSQTLHMASFYSGWDAYCLGTAKVQDHAGFGLDFFHSCELVQARREFIKTHDCRMRPRHLFGDHTLYVDEALMLNAQTILASHLTDVQERLDAGWTHDVVKQQVEESLIHALHSLFKGAPLRDLQYCHICDRLCSTWDTPDNGHDCIGVTAGTCCYDHSKFNQSRSKRANVVSNTILVWVVFAWIMAVRQPDFIIEECVPDSLVLVSGLCLFLGIHWDVQTVYLDPKMFGNPQTGMRRYTVYRNMAKRFWKQAFPHPVPLFGSFCVLDLSIFFAADKEFVALALQKARRKAGYPMNDGSISWKDTLRQFNHQTLAKFLVERYPQLKHLHGKHVLFLTDQTEKYGLVEGPYARRLLLKTMPFNLLLQRPQLASEAMLQMGMPAFEEPWRTFLSTTPDVVIREVAGNGLHPAVYAAVLLALLTTMGNRK